LDVRQIRYFLKIVEKGSFTRAAEQLGVAQPALGLQIRKLEDELQAQLLVRHARGVELTEAGRLLAEHGRAIMDRFAAAREDLAGLGRGPRSRIVLGLAPSLAGGLAGPLLTAWRGIAPDMPLHLVEGYSATLAERLHQGMLDFALGYDMSPGPGLAVRRLGSDHICLIERTAGDAVRNATAEFADIASLPLILPPMPHRVRMLVEEAARERKVSLNVVHEISGVITALDLVEAGDAVALSGIAAFRRQMTGRALRARRLVNPGPVFEFGLVHAENRALTGADLDLIALIERSLHALISGD
jgi:LysR family nitrogen assimilation transcriptional regulator